VLLIADDEAAEDSDEVLESELAERVAFLWVATSEEPEDLLETLPEPVLLAVLRCACCKELTEEPSSDSASLDAATYGLGNTITGKLYRQIKYFIRSLSIDIFQRLCKRIRPIMCGYVAGYMTLTFMDSMKKYSRNKSVRPTKYFHCITITLTVFTHSLRIS
jgi:hypothetical protein